MAPADLELGPLTEPDTWGEILNMRTPKALALTVMLAVLPSGLRADNAVSPPNPLGEKLYYEFLQAHFFSQLLPLVLLGVTVLVICVYLLVQHKVMRTADADAGFYEI